MSETDWESILDPYERLVEVRILGRAFKVPEHNLFLRGLQYLEPERVPYGDFCWNAQCFNCRCTLKRDGEERAVLCCQEKVLDGDELTELSPQVEEVLRGVLQR